MDQTTLIKIDPFKSFFDKMLAALLLLLSSPLSIVLMAAMILEGLIRKESRGPLFYTEIRVSQGKEFKLFKFRLFKVFAIENQIKKGVYTKAVENQPENLTATGKVMKKFGLDEIPQFFNILKGDMSFVGPRPKPVAEYMDDIKAGNYRRKVIRAGLTGPVQILKGTARTSEDELRADNEYVEMSRAGGSLTILRSDASILFKTLKVLAKGTGE